MKRIVLTFITILSIASSVLAQFDLQKPVFVDGKCFSISHYKLEKKPQRFTKKDDYYRYEGEYYNLFFRRTISVDPENKSVVANYLIKNLDLINSFGKHVDTIGVYKTLSTHKNNLGQTYQIITAESKYDKQTGFAYAVLLPLKETGEVLCMTVEVLPYFKKKRNALIPLTGEELINSFSYNLSNCKE